MADFCWYCIQDFGISPEENDLKGLSKFGDTMAGLYPVVICEGCGYIQVDHLGRCISKDCYEKGHSDWKREVHICRSEPRGAT